MAGMNFLRHKDRPSFKAMVVGALIATMTVPLFFISEIASERKNRAEAVLQEVAGEWTEQQQTLAGPFLVIPIDHKVEVGSGDYARVDITRHHAIILPDEVNFQMQTASEILHRGIYPVSVFSGEIVASGRFPAIDPDTIAYPLDEILWEEAFVTLSLSDTRGVRSPINLNMAQGNHVFEPGTRLAIYGNQGAHVALEGTYEPTVRETGTVSTEVNQVNFAEEQEFRLGFTLNGSSRLRFVPIGKSTTAEITSDWAGPSFQGAFLPIERELSEDGFTARWSVPNLARSFPDQFVVADRFSTSQQQAMSRTTFGVDLIVPLDHYQKVFRALRYAVIFVGFTFLSFFLVELVLKTRLHPVQYLLIGAAQSVFYLMLLSASEHIAFGTAFTFAAAATVSLVTAYGSFITRSLKVGTVLFAVLSMIYLVLYSLLQVEDLALLFGSIAIFAALALTMLVTRNVNWYGEEKSDTVPLA